MNGEDGWNIKNKEIDCSDITGLAMIVDTADIETLRQKLIEKTDSLSDGGGDIGIEDMQNAINKLFGVKE